MNKDKNIVQAIESGDAELFAQALEERADILSQNLMKEMQEMNRISANNISDARIMEERNLRSLTSAEENYYKQVIENNSFAGIEETLPRTVYDRVFDDLREDHPLLSKLQFVNTTGVTEWVFRTADVEPAWWGKLCEEIKKQLENGFKKETMTLFKLSAFVPVCKSMLKLGPVWLDRFVREMLAESISLGIEKAVIVGDGSDEPIGMIKDLAGSVVEGVYPDKEAVAITDLDPLTVGQQIMMPLTKGKLRSVGNLAMIVNPSDYWGRVFPMTKFRDVNGQWHDTNFPLELDIIQSVYVPEGKMIVGDLRNYFVGVGAPTQIEYSDEYRFLEDDRTYIAKFLGNAKPLTNDAFLVFDISGMNVVEEGAGA